MLIIRVVCIAMRPILYNAPFCVTFSTCTYRLCACPSVGMPLCRRFFDLSDTTLSALGLVSKILGLIWLAFTVNVGMLFCGQ